MRIAKTGMILMKKNLMKIFPAKTIRKTVISAGKQLKELAGRIQGKITLMRITTHRQANLGKTKAQMRKQTMKTVMVKPE